MPALSKHLEQVLTKHNRTANIQVVFSDIVKYSRRRTLTQTEVIDRFTECLSKALTRIARDYVEYAQSNDVNFSTDVIVIPTGDGAAVVFSFDGLHDIHLTLAKHLLEEVAKTNESTPCPKYSDVGWCNCHPNFSLRIGISEGRGVIYRDINGGYNVAGEVINMAARVMGLGEGGQIFLTEEAYRQAIDMVDDPGLVDKFIEFEEIPIKHGVEINAYQYKGDGETFINSTPKEDWALFERSKQVMDRFTQTTGLNLQQDFMSDPAKLLTMVETMSGLFLPSDPSKEKVLLDVNKNQPKEVDEAAEPDNPEMPS